MRVCLSKYSAENWAIDGPMIQWKAQWLNGRTPKRRVPKKTELLPGDPESLEKFQVFFIEFVIKLEAIWLWDGRSG